MFTMSSYIFFSRYDPLYQPFTTDRVGNFVFSRQPAAMGLNVGVLGMLVFSLCECFCG